MSDKNEPQKQSLQEELTALFEGEELTEGAKEKFTTIFEARVHEVVESKKQELQEEFDAKVEQEVNEQVQQIDERLERYLEYVVEKFIEDNKVAIEEGIRKEKMEAVLEDLKNVFEMNNLEIPEAKVDAVEELSKKVDALQEQLDSQLEKNSSLVSENQEFKKEKILSEVSESLKTETEKERFATLSESIEFTDEDTFKHKLSHIAEGVFGVKGKDADIDIDDGEGAASGLLEEEDESGKKKKKDDDNDKNDEPDDDEDDGDGKKKVDEEYHDELRSIMSGLGKASKASWQ